MDRQNSLVSVPKVILALSLSLSLSFSFQILDAKNDARETDGKSDSSIRFEVAISSRIYDSTRREIRLWGGYGGIARYVLSFFFF